TQKFSQTFEIPPRRLPSCLTMIPQRLDCRAYNTVETGGQDEEWRSYCSSSLSEVMNLGRRLWSSRNKCKNHARITAGPWEKALSIAHYALPIDWQGGLPPQLSPCQSMGNA